MDDKKTAIEILVEFAKRTNRQVEFTEKAYPSSALHPVTYHRRTLYIPNNVSKTSYFVCFGDSKEFGKHATFSGVFFPVEVPTSTFIEVRKKDFMDKLNPFLNKKNHTTGYRNFDSKVIITGNDPRAVYKIFDKSKIRELTLKVFDLDNGLIVSINGDEINFVPGLKGKSYFGIYSIQEWILDRSFIEKMFVLIEEFRETIR